MKIKISVRSASRKQAAVTWRTADYPDRPMTVGDFLAETVRTNAREYNERKDATELLRLFLRNQNEESLEEKLNGTAVENALQCFDDGMVALFADGVRYTRREDLIPLKEESEVTFVRLVFLAGRMW